MTPALSSYAAAHTTDPGYKSLKSYLATQTAIPSARISKAAAGEFFPSEQLIPTAIVTQLPASLQSYASSYLSGFKSVATSVAGTDKFSFSFGGSVSFSAGATTPTPSTTSASAAAATTSAAGSGAGPSIHSGGIDSLVAVIGTLGLLWTTILVAV